MNGDVYGSRILIATPTSLAHVRAIYHVPLAGDNRTCRYLRTCARGIPHERRRTDIRKIIMPRLNARGLQSKLLITPLSE